MNKDPKALQTSLEDSTSLDRKRLNYLLSTVLLSFIQAFISVHALHVTQSIIESLFKQSLCSCFKYFQLILIIIIYGMIYYIRAFSLSMFSGGPLSCTAPQLGLTTTALYFGKDLSFTRICMIYLLQHPGRSFLLRANSSIQLNAVEQARHGEGVPTFSCAAQIL